MLGALSTLMWTVLIQSAAFIISSLLGVSDKNLCVSFGVFVINFKTEKPGIMRILSARGAAVLLAVLSLLIIEQEGVI